MISLGGRILIVGAIVGLTAAIAYLAPFPSYVRVTIAMIGVAIAFIVGDRLRAHSEEMEYSERMEHGDETDPDEQV